MDKYPVVLRGGERDGEVLNLDDEPEIGSRIGVPARGDLRAGAPIVHAYRVTGDVETLPDGGEARVARLVSDG